MDALINWLLEGDPWVAYGARLSLLKQDPQDAEVLGARLDMLEHPFIEKLITELQDWPGITISSHKSAGQLFHKLAFAAELGLTRDDLGMETVITRVLAHQDPGRAFPTALQHPGPLRRDRGRHLQLGTVRRASGAVRAGEIRPGR